MLMSLQGAEYQVVVTLYKTVNTAGGISTYCKHNQHTSNFTICHISKRFKVPNMVSTSEIAFVHEISL